MTRARGLALACALALLAAGCHNATQEAECGRFIDLVNASLVEINQHTEIKGLDAKHMVTEMNTLADLYDKLAKDIGKLPITTSALAPKAEEYRRMAQSASSAARHLAVAVKDKNPKAVDAADKEFKAVVSRETGLIAGIDTACKR